MLSLTELLTAIGKALGGDAQEMLDNLADQLPAENNRDVWVEVPSPPGLYSQSHYMSVYVSGASLSDDGTLLIEGGK